MLDTNAVAAILGVKPRTITQYLFESKSGGRYADHPFPAPNGHVGKSPWWALGREDEFRDWDASRPGQGKGGGPKPKSKAIDPTG